VGPKDFIAIDPNLIRPHYKMATVLKLQQKNADNVAKRDGKGKKHALEVDEADVKNESVVALSDHPWKTRN
jgi:hypothetical protein